MIFKTMNSTYEVDEANKKIRRLEGKNPPRNSQGTDGEWKSYEYLFLEKGASAFIQWEPQDDLFRVMGTRTSTVLEIIEMAGRGGLNSVS